jgi:hypothetical protein
LPPPLVGYKAVVMSRIAQVAMSVSAVVVAVCAVVLTARVMSTGVPIVVQQQMTFNGDELAKRVQKVLTERNELPGTSSDMACPENVAIKQQATFGCSVVLNDRLKTVRVVVVDAESGAIEVGQLSG